MERLNGSLFPRSATGRSSLLPAPPWHYSGDLLTIEFRTDPAAVAELLPAPLEPPQRDEDPVRGHVQAYPKKLGSIHLTRPFTVGRAGPRLEPGGRFGATVAAADRRFVNARFTITGSAKGAGFVNALPMLHHRWLPRIEADGPDSVAEIVTMRGTDVELGPAFCGDAELELFDSPVEELTRLAPREMIGGWWRSVGTTFGGGTTLEP